MKKLIIILLSFMGGSLAALNAQESAPAHSMTRKGKEFNIGLNLNLSTLDVKSNRMVVLTPFVAGETDTLNLSSVGLMGRRRYFYYERNEKRYPEVHQNENFRAGENPDSFRWSESVPYEKWMDGSSLKLRKQVYGCCNDIIEESIMDLTQYHDYHPEFKWIVPEAELEKIRHLKGSAFIDFVVSTTDIRPEYRENRRELGKIIGTIDSLKADVDIKMDTIYIKGFASPESPYENNTRLAKGRTQALKDYVTQLYHFDENFIMTSYEPEDWEGLRRFVESSNINHKQEILEMIDCPLEPDPKEWRLKSEYPEEYAFLKTACYPALRHSDYKIIYKIRTFTDIKELKRVFEEAPVKLSLREFFTLSTAYEPGSEDFRKVFEVAAMVYPDNGTANLNAANAAMMVEELDKAERYLAKAGETPYAEYARGVLAGLRQEYMAAKALFESAAEAAKEAGDRSLEEAALNASNEMKKFNK